MMRLRITKKIKTLLSMVGMSFIVTVGSGAIGIALPSAAYAQADTTSVCNGVSLTGGTCNGDTGQFTKIIKFVIELLSLIAGVAAVVMIIVGGIRYITSAGDSSKIASAKQAIVYAIIGLVIVALAQLIVRFVLQKAVSAK